jgi:hypothetical protein
VTSLHKTATVLIAACLLSAAFAVSAQGAAVPAWVPIAASGPTNLPPSQSEIQRIGVDAEAGTFTLSFEGEETTPIAFDADAAEVETALNELAAIGGAGAFVNVRGGPGDKDATSPYFVSFEGGLAETNVPQIGADSSGLSGGGTHTAAVLTAVDGGPGTTTLAIYAQNVGGAPSSGQITISVQLPEGVTTTQTPTGEGSWSCAPGGAGQSAFSCTTEEVVGPSLTPAAIDAPVSAGPEASGTETVQVSIEGGGAPLATYEMPLTISSTPAKPGYQAFTAGAYDEEGHLDARAGAHPYSALASIMLNTVRSPRGSVVPAGEFKDIIASLPPGFLGNPVATPQCPESQLGNSCSNNTIVGISQPLFNTFGGQGEADPIFNIQAPFGYPGKFRFVIGGDAAFEEISPVGGLRSDEDYGLSVTSFNTAQLLPIYGFFFTFWGAPASPAHDSQRCSNIEIHSGCSPSDAANTAFLTNATNCAEEAEVAPFTRLSFDTWQEPAIFQSRDVGVPPVTGCDQLHFEGNFTFQPTQAASADSPAGFATELTMPSEGLTDPSKLTTPELKKTVVHFPQGVVLNPSSADGLGSCSEAQIGFKGADFPEPNRIRFDKDPNTCPDSSKIGTVDVKTALLAQTLHGALYLAAQGNGNPFGSLFAVYLVIEDPQTGTFIKLAGRTDPDPQTGQLTATFDDNPQLPFTSLKLNFKGGSRSPFATPTTCGAFTTTTEMTPWSAPESGPPLFTDDSFDVSSGPNGSPCAESPAQRPFNLGLDAGSENTNAGAFTPFTIGVTRPDGAQELSSLEITTPPGFTASLKGVPYCTEAEIAAAQASSGAAEAANPACPAASQVGTTSVGAGSGPNPFYTPGKVYLAGPYKGAPLSVVAITPALAGPFDLGVVVVRSALHVDPTNAQITAVTDPLPEYLKGVALRIRDVRIDLDRSDWALNPTSCDASSVNVAAHGNSGAAANLSSRFQVGNCAALAFHPKLTATLKGGTKRNDNPALVANLTYPPGAGYANTAFAQVTLPHSEFLDQEHIRTVCTRVQFAASACPAGAIYGHAEATSPLLDQPLGGDVYLRSSSNKLPDLVAVLKGPASQPIEIDLDGRIDSVKGGIRTTFESVPDAPVSKFTLRMQGGKRGLLVNSRNLCAGAAAKMTVRLIGQNNKRSDRFPPLGNQCAKQHKKPKKHAKKSHGRRRLSKLVASW